MLMLQQETQRREIDQLRDRDKSVFSVFFAEHSCTVSYGLSFCKIPVGRETLSLKSAILIAT